VPDSEAVNAPAALAAMGNKWMCGSADVATGKRRIKSADANCYSDLLMFLKNFSQFCLFRVLVFIIFFLVFLILVFFQSSPGSFKFYIIITISVLNISHFIFL